MYCRPPRKIKRYLTEPEEFPNDNRYKYNNLTRNELKFQVNALDTLNDIHIPQIVQPPGSTQKQGSVILPLHSKFHLRRNPLKRLPDLNTPSSNNNNGCELPKAPKGANMFKHNNPLFVVNSLFEILKQDVNIEQNTQEKHKNQLTQKRSKQSKSLRVQRGPRLLQNELTRRTQQANLTRRKIYSQQKTRQKDQSVELLTFYNPKGEVREESNQFLS